MTEDALSGPLFSVVIPTYGRPRFLAEAVTSVLAQTVDDLECIVVDDASPEPVTAPEDERVRVVRREVNGGPAAARNTGVQHASGRYVAFLDDDDCFTPDRLAIALRGLRRAPVALCWSRNFDEPPEKGRGRILEGDVSDTIREGVIPNLGQTAFVRSVFLPFDERLPASQDVEWWLRMAQQVPVATVAEVGRLLRRHDGVRHLNDLHARVRNQQVILELHADYFAVHRKARAFQWRQVGLLALQAGESATARTALWRSVRARPAARTVWHLFRAHFPALAHLRRYTWPARRRREPDHRPGSPGSARSCSEHAEKPL